MTSIFLYLHLELPLPHFGRYLWMIPPPFAARKDVEMGCGPSTPEDQRNLVISRDLKRERSMEAQVVKILLLGAGESGKSTIVKQMKLLTAVDGRESVRKE